MSVHCELQMLSAWFQRSSPLDVALPQMKGWEGSLKHLHCCRPQTVASHHSHSYAITVFLSSSGHSLQEFYKQSFLSFYPNICKTISGLILTHLHGEKWAEIRGKLRKGKKGFALKIYLYISLRSNININYCCDKPVLGKIPTDSKKTQKNLKIFKRAAN